MRETVCTSLLLLSLGCTGWQEKSPGAKKFLTRARMSQDSVVLELLTIHLPVQHRQLDEAIWREIDEQLIADDVRVQLARNGFRCGIIGGSYPPELSRMLKRDPRGRLQQLSGEGKITIHAKRIQNRAGVVHRYLLSDTVREQLHAFHIHENKLSGQTYLKAQCLLGMQTYPQPNGAVKLLIVPEVEHGEARQRWVGEEGAFRYASKRDTQKFEALRIDTALRPGQTLVITNHVDKSGLARQFFVESTGGGGKRKIVLIRLAQTQVDELFSPAKQNQRKKAKAKSGL